MMNLTNISLGISIVSLLLSSLSLIYIRMVAKDYRHLAKIDRHTSRIDEYIANLRKEVHTIRRTSFGLDKSLRDAKVCEALSRRAFSLASICHIGLGVIQKTLIARPVYLTEDQKKRNAVAKKKLTDLFGNEQLSYLEPIMTDEDLEILEQAHERALKYQGKAI